MTWQSGVLTPSNWTLQQGLNRIQLVLLQSGILVFHRVLSETTGCIHYRDAIIQIWIKFNKTGAVSVFCMVRVRPGTYIEGWSLLIVRVNIYPVAFFRNIINLQQKKERWWSCTIAQKHNNKQCLSRQELYFAIKSASASWIIFLFINRWTKKSASFLNRGRCCVECTLNVPNTLLGPLLCNIYGG